MVVDLVGSDGTEARVRPVAVVPGKVEPQLLLHRGETVRDQNQSPRALVLDGSDATLDHGDAAIASDGAEPLADPATAAPALELPGDELAALVGDEVPRPHARPPEKAFEKSPNGRGGWLAAEDGEAHDAPGAVIDDDGKPPAEGPDLRQGEGAPRSPESERRGHGRQVNMPEVIRLSGGHRAGGRL